MAQDFAAEEISDGSHFPVGTFTPNPHRAAVSRVLMAQGKIETKLFLRHGEQQLLNIILPLAGLLALAYLPILPPGKGIQDVFPLVLAVASVSSAFTGQAILLAFDRRYGALKRTGASGVPTWTIVCGKIIAVLAMTLLQLIVLGGTALFLGWRTSPLGLAIAMVTLMLGVALFTALGLLMGGTLSSELVLALANLIWVVLTGITAWALLTPNVNPDGLLSVIPSVALAQGLTVSFQGTVPIIQWISLLTWLAITAWATDRWFSFDSVK